jgi:hypothetical protein
MAQRVICWIITILIRIFMDVDLRSIFVFHIMEKAFALLWKVELPDDLKGFHIAHLDEGAALWLDDDDFLIDPRQSHLVSCRFLAFNELLQLLVQESVSVSTLSVVPD